VSNIRIMDNTRKPHLIASALLAAALVIAAFTLSALSASAASPLKITNCNKSVSKPKSITLACADAGIALNKLSWSSFGGSTAKGKGTFALNTCEPNCAAGKNVSYPVSILATGSKKCKGASVYSKLTLTFTGSKKPKLSVKRIWTLGCPASL
jgi:hypothetical protein